MPDVGTSIVEKTDVREKIIPEKMYQLILHNDDAVYAGDVVDCLVGVIGHPHPLAMKIMFEAHRNGRAIAEVDSKEAITKHRAAFQARGIPATVEKV